MQQSIDPSSLEQNLTLRDYLHIINKRRLTVITVFLIVFTISLILGLSKETPRYTSISTILLERNMGNNSIGLGTYYVWDPQFLPTQTEIIKSKKVALRVVDMLQLDTTYYSHFFSGNEKKVSFISTMKNTIKLFFTSLFTSDYLEDSAEVTSTTGNTSKEKNIIAEIIKANIEVQPVKETRVVNILYTDTNRNIAQKISDTLVQAYIEETLEIKLSGTKQSLKWMTNKAEEERKKLEDAERNLQKYLREHNLITLENRLAVYPEKLSQFSTDLSKAESERKELEDQLNQISKTSKSSKALEALPIFARNPNLQSLRDQILKAEQLTKELSKKYGPKHPAMIKAIDDREILIQEKNMEFKRISDSTQQAYLQAKSKEKNFRERLTSTKEELLDVNERFIQYSIMKREVESSRALYEALTSSLKKASVTEESQNLNIWVMREATLPGGPSNQKPKRTILIGLFMSLAAGIGAALLIEYLDNTIKTPDDIENKYGLTVLGSILEAKKTEEIETIIVENPQSPIAENYRMIRSNLLLSSADHPPCTILTTSMRPRAGKTSTTLNLARTLAQISDKILIIDADMRKPRIHSLLGISNETGLSSYLSGNIDEKIIKPTREKHISVIPSGPIPPNPVELISAKSMKTLLKYMSQKYDFILIDSPPITNLADGLILSTLVDGTILVARAGETTFEAFSSGLKMFNEIKPHMLGVLLNAVSHRVSDRYSYYNYLDEYYSKDKELEG